MVNVLPQYAATWQGQVLATAPARAQQILMDSAFGCSALHLSRVVLKPCLSDLFAPKCSLHQAASALLEVHTPSCPSAAPLQLSSDEPACFACPHCPYRQSELETACRVGACHSLLLSPAPALPGSCPAGSCTRVAFGAVWMTRSDAL